MKTKMFRLGISLGLWMLSLSVVPLSGQVVQGLWHAGHVGYRLPGTVPAERLVIQLPGYGMGMYNSGFTYQDLSVTTNNNIYAFDVTAALDKMEEDNAFAFGGGLQTLGVGWRMGKWWVEAGHQLRFDNFVDYPRDLFAVFFQGNAPYIGRTARLGMQVQTLTYNEWYAGTAIDLGSLSLGARVKMLNGALGARTERSQLDLYTSDDVYQLELNSDFLLYTSPELGLLQGEDFDPGLGLDRDMLKRMLSRNRGLALDFGAQLQVTEKWRLDLAVMDLGGINWTESLIGYQSRKTVSYDGYTFTSLFADDSLSLVGALDTLEALLGFEEIEGAAFRTSLPWYIQAGGHYVLSDRWRFSGMFFGQRRGTRFFTGMSFGANLSLGRVLDVGAHYSIFDRTYGNLGVNTLLRLGPVRMYAATDNILSLFNIKNSRYANGRVGLQLAF